MDAMRALTSGESCSADGTSASANPLTNMVNQGLGMNNQGKHGNPAMNQRQYGGPRGAVDRGDNGLHQGMAQGMGLSQRAPRGMPMARGAPQISGDAFVREFEAQQQFQQNHHPSAHHPHHPHQQQQRMQGGPMQHVPHMGPRGPMARGAMAEDWVRGFEQMHIGGGPQGSMDAAFAQSFRGPPRAHAWAQEMAHLPPGATKMHEEAFHDGTTGNDWAKEAVNEMNEEQAIEEREAADLEATRRATAEMANTMSQDARFKDSEFLNFMKQVSSGAVTFKDNEVVVNPNAPQIEREVQKIQSTSQVEKEQSKEAPSIDGTPATMSEAWGSAGQSMEEMFAKAWEESLAGKDVDIDQIFQEALKQEQQLGEGLGSSWAQTEFMNPLDSAWKEAEADPATTPYQLNSENPFSEHESPYEEGLRLFKEGRTQDAILAFEAAVSQDSSNADAWRMLGVAHQENDEDRRAIACLERAVDEDPYHLDALLGLGVSYVNELDEARALKNLKTWVNNNPAFQGLEVEVDPYSDGSLMDEVMQLMLKAADWAPQDSGVQEVLGVLYNVSRDYDSAAAAFRKAISRKPDDYSLWNKMGATLANGSKSEEALPAYHRALELKPRYVRGWLNLGISHSNLGQYSEAARCYLKALDLNPEANHIWSYLRIAFTIMERPDLCELANAKNLDAFRTEFKF